MRDRVRDECGNQSPVSQETYDRLRDAQGAIADLATVEVAIGQLRQLRSPSEGSLLALAALKDDRDVRREELGL